MIKFCKMDRLKIENKMMNILRIEIYFDIGS